MTRHLRWLIPLVIALLVMLGVARAIVSRKAQQQALAQTDAAVQRQVTQLQAGDVITLQTQTVHHQIAVSGTLTAQDSAIVKAKVSGELLQFKVREGDRVHAGQVLGQIDTQEYDTRLRQARQQAESAKAQWRIAQQNLQNNQALVKQGFISRNALDTSESNEAATRATYEAAQAAVDLADKAVHDARIRAPIDGLVSQRFAQVGERLNVDGRLFEIVDLHTLELQAPLSPQDVAQVRVGDPARLHVDGLADTLTAKVVRINPSASADTRAVTVYLALPAHPALRQGLFAQGQIQLGSREALSLPPSAITRDDGQDRVLRVAGHTLQAVHVQLDPSPYVTPEGNPAWAVQAGLRAGDTVLRNASGTLQAGQAVQLPASAPR